MRRVLITHQCQWWGAQWCHLRPLGLLSAAHCPPSSEHSKHTHQLITTIITNCFCICSDVYIHILSLLLAPFLTLGFSSSSSSSSGFTESGSEKGWNTVDITKSRSYVLNQCFRSIRSCYQTYIMIDIYYKCQPQAFKTQSSPVILEITSRAL